ncbi:hypothetical protein OG909_32865 (plasmid) [Streptomyces sp. NBC_01754]|uniref:hypothetical protein n=1 Tax=Streptomyces sp. NBC_01754 TaxID=2975930 RepID=UPI002DD9A927|nr:hypothetical protein [Streptomyces sp. NBC_01754]WSC97099.1 hypothetical protein OG909_32865 [Streptomyces sp. NBC_01754]
MECQPGGEIDERVAVEDDPDPYTTTPGHTYAELIGGPLNGQLLDVTSYTPAERSAGGALLMTNHGTYGPGGRADYVPRPADPDRWDWNSDVP